MSHRFRRQAFAAVFPIALMLVACGKAPAGQQDLEGLDRELADTNGTNTARDPALTAALADQIMVDPKLAQSSNADAVRPPSRPDSGAVPSEIIPLRPDPVPAASLKHAPAAAKSCPECDAAKGALTLGALAGRQASAADCAQKIGYSAMWSNRLPVALPLYPDARVAEAAGTDEKGCSLRIVSFVSAAPVQRVIDYYYTKAHAAGYSAGHRTDGTQHVLGGTRGNAAYVVYVSARGSGSDVDLIVNGGH